MDRETRMNTFIGAILCIIFWLILDELNAIKHVLKDGLIKRKDK